MAEEGRIFADSNSALTSAEDALIQSLDLGLRTDGEVELKDLPLLGGFEPEELEELERIAEKRSYPAKTYIIKEGEKSDGFFLLTSGRASVLAGTDSDDRQVSLVIFDVGTMFGELSLLLEDPIRTASVYAVTDASCYFISVDALDQLQANEPSLYAKLVTNMGTNLARRLIDASETIRDHGL